MDISKMIAELHAERAAVDEALAVLERLARGQRKRRGRPPAWLTRAKEEEGVPPVVQKKRTLSPEAKKRMAEAQKKRWAAYRKAQAAEAK